jgi:signal transduction histidine kinase
MDWLRFPRNGEARKSLAARTALITAAILAVVMPADFVTNVWVLHAIANYTPLSTLFITLLIAPPSTLFLLLQTERVREAQGALASEQAARAALEAVNAARSRFLANTSHELRTPLSGIIGYTELLIEAAQEDGRPRDLADLERVAASAQRMLDLVNDLLELAKLEADRIEIAPAPYDVAEMLQAAADAAAPDLARRGAGMRVEIGAALPAGYSDRERLQHCVTSLIAYAARTSSDKLIKLGAEVRGERLLIWVEADSAGVAPDRQPLLFEPFLHAQTEAEGRDGSGLELAISRRLARLLGGDVVFESPARHRARLLIEAPLRLEPSTPLAAPAHARNSFSSAA